MATVTFAIREIDAVKHVAHVTFTKTGVKGVSLTTDLLIPTEVVDADSPSDALELYLTRVAEEDMVKFLEAIEENVAEKEMLDLSMFSGLISRRPPVFEREVETARAPEIQAPKVETLPQNYSQNDFIDAVHRARYQLKKRAQLLRDRIYCNHSPVELAMLPIRLEEAKRFMMRADANAHGKESELYPVLVEESLWRGVGLAKIAEEAIDEASKVAKIDAHIRGVHMKLLDKLGQIDFNDTEALNALDLESEWPDL